ncbi:hypothetical protein [Streptomyces sp. NPDC001480]|uniref:hypothetical protein n=1 Tax=Streptomyces sp. NPDC001480 TaxID=3364577 RepID=UPI0036C95CFD
MTSPCFAAEGVGTADPAAFRRTTQAHLEDTGWTVRVLPTETGAPALLARDGADRTVARSAPAADGTLRVAVPTPAVRRTSATA